MKPNYTHSPKFIFCVRINLHLNIFKNILNKFNDNNNNGNLREQLFEQIKEQQTKNLKFSRVFHYDHINYPNIHFNQPLSMPYKAGSMTVRNAALIKSAIKLKIIAKASRAKEDQNTR